MKPILSTIPAVAALAGWAAGILLWYCGAGWGVAAVAAAIGCISVFRRAYVAMAVMYALAAGWAVARIQQPDSAPAAVLDGRMLQYSGTVRSVHNTDEALSLVVDVDSIDLQPCRPFGVRIASVPEWIPPRVGDVLRFTAELDAPEVHGIYRHAPDYTLRCLTEGVVASAYVDSDYTVVGYRGGFRAAMAARRDAVVSMLAGTDLTDTCYGLLAAILTGFTDDLEPGLREGFTTVGIAHALALSGFHIGVISLLVSLMLYPLRAWPRLRPWRLAAGVVAVWAYAFMVGMPDSVFRAVLMLTIYIAALISGRGVNPYNTLCSAVIIILAVRPYSLFSAGFQLSVCAVAGILVFAEKFNPVNPRSHRLHTFVAPMAVACAALLGTMPVTLTVFHRLPLLFLVSNVLIVILLPVLMFGGIMLLACVWAGIGTALLCRVLNTVAALLDGVVDGIARIPATVISDIYLSHVQIAMLVLAIAAAGLALHVRSRSTWCSAALVLLLFCSSLFWARENIPESEAFVLPMRGNTAFAARYGSKMAVTLTCHERYAGTARSNIERALEHYMAACRVDTLIVTSADFSLGQYSRRGDMLDAGGVRVALLVRPGRPDSLEESPHYALVGNRCRLSAADIVRLIHPDTLVLGYDLSPARRRQLSSSGMPYIDLNECGMR